MDSYVILWTERTRRGSTNRWKACPTPEAVLSVIRDECLENDPDVVILSPETMADAVPVRDFLDQYA